jgi:hypothetical protein
MLGHPPMRRTGPRVTGGTDVGITRRHLATASAACAGHAWVGGLLGGSYARTLEACIGQ